MAGSIDFAGAAKAFTSDLAAASPFGAAANAIQGLAAGGPSQSGDSTSGGAFGTVNIAGIGSGVSTPVAGAPVWLWLALAGLAAVVLIRRR